jgi:hypothetical protein
VFYRERSTTMSATTNPGPSRGDYDLSNPVGGFTDVVRRVVARPAEFFSGIPRRGNFLAPLIFALICIEISTILGGLLRLAWQPETMGGVRYQGMDYNFGSFIADVILAPIGGAIGLFILAAIAHLLVILFVGGANSGYESTFRVVAYVSVTSLINWIPLIGGASGSVWALPCGCGHKGDARNDHGQSSAGGALTDRFDLAVGAHSCGRGGRRHPESPELEKAKKFEVAREGRKHGDKARVSSPLQPPHISCGCACRKTGRCSQDSAKAR